MLAKLCVLILALGVCGGALLQLRQARLQVVHELARVQLRMNERDRDLFRIRAQLAQRTSPESVEQLAARFGPLSPLGVHLAEDLPAASGSDSPRPPSVRPASHVENHAQVDER
ncbi:MAG: hypothetical protein AB7K52_08655 [Phycisphaerales bacterium]